MIFSSGGSFLPDPLLAVHTASKVWVHTFSRSMVDLVGHKDHWAKRQTESYCTVHEDIEDRVITVNSFP